MRLHRSGKKGAPASNLGSHQRRQACSRLQPRICYLAFLVVGGSRNIVWAMYACMLGRWHRSIDSCTSERMNVAYRDGAVCAYVSTPRVVTGDVRSSAHAPTSALRLSAHPSTSYGCMAWWQGWSRACCHVTSGRGGVGSRFHPPTPISPRLTRCGMVRNAHHLSAISTLIEPLHEHKAVVALHPQSGFGMRK